MKWLLRYTLTAFLMYAPAWADSEATPSSDKGNSENAKADTAKNGKAWTAKTDPVPYPVMTPGEIETHVNRLRKGIFSDQFREAYRRALEQAASPLEMDLGAPPEVAEELPPVDPPADTAAEPEAEAVSESQPRPFRETIRERIVERVIIQVPQTNTRIIFVQRPKPLPAARRSREKEEEKSGSKTAATAPAAAGTRVTSGAPTVIRAPGGSGGGALFGGRKLTPRETAQAERSFREFDTILPSAASTPARAAAPAAGAPREKKAREEKPGWKDEIVYVDDYGDGKTGAPGDAGAGRGELTAAQAAIQPGELTFGTFARSAVETVRRKTAEFPAVVLLINVLLMLGTALAFSLLAVRRRRTATALALSSPLSPAVRRPPPMPSRAVALLPSPEEMDDEELRREVTNGTGISLNDDMRVVFDPTLRRWVLKRRDPGGRLSAPLAELQAGTVVRGAALGAASPQTRYKLSPSNTWIPTEEGEQIIIAVRPSHFRAI